MKHPEQHQQVQLTAQAQTAYSGMRETSMAEPQAEQPKPNRFRRVIHKLRRRKPQQLQRARETAEEERKKKEQEAAEAAAEERRIQEQLQRNAEAARRMAQESFELEENRSNVEQAAREMKAGGSVAVLQKIAENALPTEEISNRHVLEVLESFNKDRELKKPITSDQLIATYNRITSALGNSSFFPPTPEALLEAERIRNLVLPSLQQAVLAQQISEAAAAMPASSPEQLEQNKQLARAHIQGEETARRALRSSERDGRGTERSGFYQGVFIDTRGISDDSVLRPVRIFQSRFPLGGDETYTLENLQKLQDDVMQAMSVRETPLDLPQENLVTEQVLKKIDKEIRKMYEDARKREQEANQRASDRYERAFLGDVLVEDENGDERAAKIDDMLGDRGIRDRIFDSIFAAADGRAYEFWNDAFDVLRDGAKLSSFMASVNFAIQDRGQISDQAALIFAKKVLRQKRHQVGGAQGNWSWLGSLPQDWENLTVQSLQGAQGKGTRTALEEMKREIQQELRADLRRYQIDKEVKQTLHNANAVIEKPNVNAEQLYGFVDGFSSELIDYVMRKPGLREMMNIIEEQMRRTAFMHDGYIPPEKIKRSVERKNNYGETEVDIVEPEIDTESLRQFRQLVAADGVYYRSDETGDASAVIKKDFQDWEIDSLLVNARGMMVLSMRMLSLAAENRIPLEARYTSMFLQDVIQNYAPYTHLLWKYHVPSDKALGLLLTEPDREKWLFGTTRKPWATKHMVHVKHVLEGHDDGSEKGKSSESLMGEFKDDMDFIKDSPAKLLNSPEEQRRKRYGKRLVLDGHMGEMLQIRRLNPGFCGDYAGFIGWRAGQDPVQFTGAERFLNNGLQRMESRWGIPGSGAKENYDTLIATRDKHKKYLNEEKKTINPKWFIANKHVHEYQNEYSSWIGTGLRLERMRGDLLGIVNGMEEKSTEGKGKLSEKNQNQITAAENLLERIAELQPHRLFLKSYKMQKRFDGALLDAHHGHGGGDHGHAENGFDAQSFPGRFKAIEKQMPQVFDNLHFLETKMLQLREELLGEGYVFDKYGRDDSFPYDKDKMHPLHGKEITLDVVLEKIGGPKNLPHKDDWAATQEFRKLVMLDFNHYKDKKGYWTEEHGHKIYKTLEEGQFREFIYAREYNHGFTLWDGDAPKDEFNMAATGPTGGYIRRARENKDVGEANMLITGMFSDLKYMQTPDEAFKHLAEIYSKIQSYDAGMAKETMVYLTEGLLKFYGSTGVTNAPILGMIVENYPGLIPALYKMPYKIPKAIIDNTAMLIPKAILKGMKMAGKKEAVDKWDAKIVAMKEKLGKIPGVAAAKDLDAYFTGSFAQQVFEGKRAAVWRAYDKHYLIQHLLSEHGYITPEQAKYLKGISSGRSIDVGANFVSFFGPFIALAIVLFLLKESTDDV